MRFISTRVHGVVDYLMGLLLIVAPFLFGFATGGSAQWVPIIHDDSLACKTRRKFKATTNSKHDKPIAPNLLDRYFAIEKSDLAYGGDITYMPTRKGWLYLTVFTDLYSRALVGWSRNSRMPR